MILGKAEEATLEAGERKKGKRVHLYSDERGDRGEGRGGRRLLTILIGCEGTEHFSFVHEKIL